jgi:hypothetical protein
LRFLFLKGLFVMTPLHFDSLVQLLRCCSESHTTATAVLRTIFADDEKRIKLLPRLMAMTPKGQEPMQMVLAEQARYLMGELQGTPGSADLQRRLKAVLDLFRANEQRITAGRRLLQGSPNTEMLDQALIGARTHGLSVLEARLRQAIQRSTSAPVSELEAKEIEIFKTWPEKDDVKRSLQNELNPAKAVRPQLGLTASDIRELQSWPSPYFTGLKTSEEYITAYKHIKNAVKTQNIPNFTMREVVSMFAHSQKNGRLNVNMAIARAAALRREINKSPMANRMSFESFKDLYASSSKNLFKQGASPKEVVQVVENQLKALDEYHPGGNLSLLQREAESLEHDSPVIQAAKNMEETKQEAMKLGVGLFQLNQMNEERIRDGKSPQRIAKEYSIIQKLNNIPVQVSEYDDEYEEMQFAIKYFELRRSVPPPFPSELNIDDPKIIENILREARMYEYFILEVDEMYENDDINTIKFFDPALSVKQNIDNLRVVKQREDFESEMSRVYGLTAGALGCTIEELVDEYYRPSLSLQHNMDLVASDIPSERFYGDQPSEGTIAAIRDSSQLSNELQLSWRDALVVRRAYLLLHNNTTEQENLEAFVRWAHTNKSNVHVPHIDILKTAGGSSLKLVELLKSYK